MTWDGLGGEPQPPRPFFPVPYNGWNLLIAWTVASKVDPRFVQLAPQTDHDRTVHVVITEGITTRHRFEPITNEVRELEHELVSAYLADADVPPVPCGFDVQLTLPAGVASFEELIRVIHNGFEAAQVIPLSPQATREALDRTIPAIYAT